MSGDDNISVTIMHFSIPNSATEIPGNTSGKSLHPLCTPIYLTHIICNFLGAITISYCRYVEYQPQPQCLPGTAVIIKDKDDSIVIIHDKKNEKTGSVFGKKNQKFCLSQLKFKLKVRHPWGL